MNVNAPAPLKMDEVIIDGDILGPLHVACAFINAKVEPETDRVYTSLRRWDDASRDLSAGLRMEPSDVRHWNNLS